MAFSHEDYLAARRRRLETNALIASGDPGRFSPFERNALLGMQHTKGGDIAYVDRSERAGLRQHEMDMLKQTGVNEFKVAEQKRLGMENQGIAVGRLKYGFVDDKGNRVDGSDILTERERQMGETTRHGQEWGQLDEKGNWHPGGRERVAQTGLTQSELEWGSTNKDGTRKPGGREAVAGIEGKSRVDAAREQAKLAAEQNEQRRALEEQKRLAADEREKARLALKYEELDEQKRKNIDIEVNRRVEASMGKLSPSDARAQVMAEREQMQQQGQPPKDGETKTHSSGRKVIARNGKWEFAD